ncbi:protease inhibitor Inh/omp19 family protein [Aquibium sp. A9E412]|uniref:protease inhibitor Inh/omp19 family protein n=1 Tax=Aquibium sp. A9E412 TaxID=2976767 RepID=UPI0025B0D1DB|nr:protease inhibitor Inh/omp19 family protein [Aquibium sp. A9E412]MDN2565687.1 protease inhibitor Inh/omp19 family protein [Aquibium sp. A9E412]
MNLTKTGVVAVSLATLFLAGCQTERLSPMAGRAPAPLPPAPSGTVTQGQLPPPTTPDASEFPEAPGAGEETQVAALDPEAAASAPDITAGSVAGVWSVNVAGQSCRVATPQTKFGEGFRAGPLRCPAPLDSVKSWNVSGKQLALYDETGSVIARLYSSGAERFDGQTTDGQPVSLSR